MVEHGFTPEHVQSMANSTACVIIMSYENML